MKEEVKRLKAEVGEVLENNILSFWLDKMQDEENGGFYGQMTGEGQLVKEADKGGILNARILWSFSAAYRVLRKPEYLEAATRAKDYIIDHFIDREYGGTYWSLDYKGQPKDTKKQFYAIGFMIYGMKAAESCNYVPAIGSVLPINVTVPDETVNRIEASLRNLIDIFTENILNPETHHLDLFFDMDWTRQAGRLESYGHDIECSWLLHEAALVLGDEKLLRKVEEVVRMVAKASEKGLNADGSMVHEANLDTGYIDTDRHWWVQAENVVGWVNIYQYFGDEDALRKALRGWQYIKDNLIDHEGGEWWWSRDPERNINRKDDKAGFWKCPYHNSRMCLEIIERIM